MPFKYVKNDLEINLNTFLYAVLTNKIVASENAEWLVNLENH